MFSKTVLLSAIVLGFANQAFGHAAIQPQLGIQGNSTRNDVQQPSTSSPCGNTDIASNINNSTAVALDSTNSFSTSIVNFNGGQDGSTQVTAQVDPTGTGKSFASATVTQNGQLAPPAAGSAQLSVSLPAGTKCTGGTAGNLCLVSFKTAGNFGNCIVVSQTNNAAVSGGSAAGASGASSSVAVASSSVASSSVAAASSAAAASTGNSTTTTTGKKHKGHHKGGKKGAKGSAASGAAGAAATNDAAAAAGGKKHKGHKHHKGAANSTADATGAAAAASGTAAAADTSVAAAAASTSAAPVAARAHTGAAAAAGGKKHKAHGARAPRALLKRVASEGADCVGNTKRGLLGWMFA